MGGDDLSPRARAEAAGLTPAPPPDEAISPGESLRVRLAELAMTQAELAVRTGLTPKHLNQLLHGLVPLSADVAQRLEYATGVPARWWNRLEADFRSTQTRLDQARAADAHTGWVRVMPVRQLVGLGVLPPSPSDVPSRLAQLLAFFGVASPEAHAALWARPAAAFRQSSAHPVDDMAVSAWLRLGELAADRAAAAEFDPARLRSVLPEIRRLTAEPLLHAWPKARDLLAGCGLVVVLVPEVTGARAYGAARWIGGRPVVQLSLRGKTDDAFWLTLFHELGHVLLHGRRAAFVDFDDEGDGEAEGPEREATRFAVDVLFAGAGPDRLGVVVTDDDATAVADVLGIGAGLVVSRLHALGLWDRKQGARLRRRTPTVGELTTGEPVGVRPRPVRRARSARGPGSGSGS